MGWSIKPDVSVDWNQILQQPRTAAVPENQPLMRRQQPQQQPEFSKCPRCASTNTKFCYYNNYNKSQPRHFCKSCKRHWTKGGTLRNVPVGGGGGGRKNKRPKKSNPAAAASQNQDCPNFQLSSTANLDRKITPCSIYRTLFSSSSSVSGDAQKIPMASKNGSHNITSLNELASQNENTESFSSLSTFEMDSFSEVCQYPMWDLDPAEESAVTSVNYPSTSGVQRLQIVGSCGNGMDLASEWNWNGIDELVSPEFNISWDNNDSKVTVHNY